MSEYRIRSTGEIITNIRAAFPNVSMPASISPATLDWLGVDPIMEGAQPAGLSVYQYAQRDGVEQLTDGRWYTKYIAAPVFENAEDETAYKAQRDAEQWAAIREERNARLASSDWTQLADAPVDDLAWAVYRQALRDITLQADPFGIVWPVAP
jgi:hypothetical protein